MAVREVLLMGHPVLQQRALPVEDIDTLHIQEILVDMRDTMAELDGAGLAAPQIGISLRIIMFGIAHNPRYPEVEPIAETVLINPEIDVLDDSMEEGWEGCLSIPGMRGNVPRHSKIRYRGYSVNGERIDRTVDGFHARVVQHEYDHLEGILYPQRMIDMSDFGFEQALLKRSDENVATLDS